MTLGATKPPYFSLPLRTMFPFYTPQIENVAPPTDIRLPDVSICRSLPTVFPLTHVRLLTQASPMSCILSASLDLPRSDKGTQCVYLSYSSPLSPKGPTYLTHTVELFAPPPCRKIANTLGSVPSHQICVQSLHQSDLVRMMFRLTAS